MVKFLQYSAGLIARPHRALRMLLGDPQRVGFGFLGHLILAAVYFIGISVVLAMDVAHLPQLLVLNIPVEHYHSYERFFISGFTSMVAVNDLACGPCRDDIGIGRHPAGSPMVERKGSLRGSICSPWLQFDHSCFRDGPARPRNRYTRWNWRPGPTRFCVYRASRLAGHSVVFAVDDSCGQ